MGYFFYSISLLSLFIVFVLTVSFYLTKTGVKSVNKIFSILIFLFGIQIAYSFSISSYAYSYFINWHKELFLIRQTALLIGPLIYIYFSAFYKNRQIKLSDLFHFTPFIGMLLFLCISYNKIEHLIIWESKLDLYDTILILSHNMVYIILSILKLKKFSFSVKEIIKNLKVSSHKAWFQFVILGFIILWVINLNIFATYMILKRPIWCAYTGSIYSLAFFFFLCSIMFFLILKPEICFLIEKYKSNPIDDNIKIKYIQPLSSYMDIRKPYLDSEVTLDKVAKDMSINTRILSQIINESFKNNFKGYMNEFRLKESINQLSDINNKKTILEILFDSGFNSKSVFYTEFKRHTGITPQEYRARCNKLKIAN